MNCSACGKESDRLKAHYCKTCGKDFSDEERKEAYAQTAYGKIDKILEAKEWITLSKITNNLFVRIAILLVLGLMVLGNVRANGSKLAIQNGDGYSLAYCEETDEYYVLTDKESVSLSVYVPKKADSCVIESYVDGSLREKLDLEESSSAVVHSSENGYFLLKAAYENGDSEEILFFVCREVAQ